ncbi:hypothetical protein HYN59_04425 [Flavobacterium album]|uniref:PKD domain-containing protein n=1 Tax=Flavobacterium album TaxID=2175091 RepID=A0A2S1QVK4_9FLAO|nr:T9SS sorting signal type C domain-containing protein [Flavobacterium album]AWH84406.1 hypothetical protein HYN59_04425 [Flavobacterium album]
MNRKLLNFIALLVLAITCIVPTRLSAQTTTVFSSDFNTSAGTTYSTVNGAIGTSTTWSLLRSGSDFGARINSGYLALTNDATGSSNVSGWALAYTSGALASPYNTTLSSNPGLVTWTFNMRQIRSNPSGTASGYYANAFILAGTSNTTATTGSGYAVILGQSGKTDRLRLIRYTAGIRTSSDLLTSTTAGLGDFGNQYLSVRITFNPATGVWEMFVRNDGSVFQDPAAGSLTSQGTVTNTTSAGTALPLIGAYWNGGTKRNQTSFFDNIKVTVATPFITTLSPPSRIAGTGAFNLVVGGSNFTAASVVRWNGSNRTTTYNSSTGQLTAAILATDIATAGTAAITVQTGTAISNSVTFTIDQLNVPTISPSTNVLPSFTTITGTASAAQSFTTTGTNLTGSITASAPANFEVSLNSGSGYAAQITTIPAATTTVYVRAKNTTPGVYSGNITLSTAGGVSKFVAVSAVVLSTEPTTSASSIAFSNVTSISFTTGWTPGNGTNRLVVMRSGSAVNALPVDGVSYTASTVFASGSDLGGGNYVVYNGTSNSVTVTELSPTTTYYVSIFDFNGSGGTENYRTTSPLTGSRATLNAPAGLQITALNTINTITFDSSVEGVNNNTFNGGGLSPIPEQGELNSNGIAISGFSIGDIAFGGDSPEDTTYDSGQSDGGEVDAGLYAFQVLPGNYALGVQPAAGEFSPGTITLKFQNQTASTITSVSVGYKIYVYNDEAGSNSLNLSYSTTATGTYTALPSVNFTTTAAPDATPGWKAYYKVVTIPITVASNNYGFIRWSGAAVSGTAYDEIAIDDIVVVGNPTSTFASLSGTAETFTVAGNAMLSGATTVNGDIAFLNNSYLAIGANTLTLSGTVTNTTAGGLRGSASGSLVVNGLVSPTLSFDQTTAGTTNLLNNLTIATTNANTVTAGNTFGVAGTLTVNELQTLNMGTNALSGALTTIVNNGIITTQNTSSTPLPTGKTWGGTGTVTLNGSAQQTLVPGTYNNVTISNAAGAVVTIGNATINGILSLPNANPSATLGSLSTGSNTLFLGPDATTSGIGEVSGIVTHNTGIIANKLYNFGYRYTSILFPPVGTLPTSMSLKIELGVTPTNKTDAVSRRYEFIQTGGTGTKAIITSHYLDTELNGNTESRLVDYVVPIGAGSAIEQSRTNYSTINNFVELSNVNVAFFGSTFGTYQLGFANSQAATLVWNGSVSNSWTTAANWTPTGSPSFATNVIIPDAATTPNVPTYNDGSEVATMSIELGGILNAPAASTFTVKGTSGAWINKGTFNPSTGTVVFDNNSNAADATIAGVTTFNNLTVNSGTTLRALTNADIRLAGTFTKTGTFITGAIHSTFRYTGTNQTVVTPNGAQSSYHNLVISGTGAVFPTTLNINGDLTINNTVDFTGKTIAMTGIEEEGQRILGTVNPVFNNLTINNTAADVSLATNITVAGTLTLTSGRLNIIDNNLTLGTNAVAGTFSSTSMIESDGNGVVRRPYTGTGSYFFPVGEGIDTKVYSPIAVNITSGTFSGAYVSVNMRDAKHPNNNSLTNYLTHYWNVTQTGITNAVATVTANYTPEDIVGSENNIAAAQLNGTFNVSSNPWIKYSLFSGGTLTAANATLTAGQTSSFTGINSSAVVVDITGEGAFCQGDAVTLSADVSGGTTPYSYTWSGGLGTGATATPPTASAGTTTYTLTVRDANGIASTDTANVTVTTAPVAGTLSSSQEICANTTPANVTLTGYNGTIVRWERSTSTAFTNPAFIASTSATLTGAQIGSNLTSTRYIRAVVQNGSCPIVYSNAIEIKVSSTTWDGTWSNGVPTATTAVIFNSDYTLTADMSACTVVVNTGANVVVPSGFNMTVNGAVTVNGGTFTVQNNANLVQVQNVSNTGNISVIKNSSPIYRLDYTMWSSPVAGPTLEQFSPMTLPNRFYHYNPVSDAYATVPGSTPFDNGVGYLIRVANDHTPFVNAGTPGTIWTGTFTGVPHNGNINVAVTPSGGGVRGYNAVGNPYPSSINIADFYAANANNLGTDTSIYFWRKKNDATASSYASLTLAAYISNSALGGDTSNGVFSNPNQSSQWVINTAQGFIVQAKTSTIAFTNAMRRGVNNGQFFRSAQDASISRLWLNLNGLQGEFSQMAVAYTENTTTGLDYGWDGRALTDGEVAVYSLAEGSQLGIQARPAFDALDVVPVEYKITNAGTYTLLLDHVDGVFTEGQDIFVKDNFLGGATHNLTESPYEFTTEAGTITGRFDIVYAETLGTANPVAESNKILVYKQGNAINISSGNVDMKSVSVYDTRGRLLYSADDINAATTAITGLQLQEQMLIVEITTASGTRTSRKIIF